MNQRPSEHYARGIQPPTQDGSHRRVHAHPVEPTNRTTPYDLSNRENSSVPGDPRYQEWYRATGELATQNTPHSDYNAPQHYISANPHSRKDVGDGLERVPWQEEPSQTTGAFHTRDSARANSFLPALSTGALPLRDHRRDASACEVEGQERRHWEQRRDPPITPSGSGSRGSPSHEHHGPPIVSRHPSLQSFGPYTTTALHRARNPSTFSGGGDHLHFRSPSDTFYPGQEQLLTHQIPYNNETPQYVVPSSRIPRADQTVHSPPAGYFNTARVSHSPEEASETKPKRRRANAAQLQLLNDTYARTMFPTTEERADIARRINMTPRQVQIWFQNRRQASRQNQTPEPGTPSGLAMEGTYGEGHSDYLHEPEND
ncbi:hypothetical protein OPQ81_010439 [Rhizoctonia solani]|nr:hypothetical protein OPQ81_010439 [Rhizoctonia solani]